MESIACGRSGSIGWAKKKEVKRELKIEDGVPYLYQMFYDFIIYIIDRTEG